MTEEKKDVKKEASATSTETKVVETDSEKALKARISELSSEKKELTEQLGALTQTVQNIINKPKEEVDDPDLDPNIKKVQKQIKELGGALAANFDNQDKIEVRLDPNINQKDYAKKEKEVEKLRKDYATQKGVVYSRKEIYFFLKGQEKGQEKEEPEKKEEETTPMPETKTTVKETQTTPKTTEELGEKLKDVKF